MTSATLAVLGSLLFLETPPASPPAAAQPAAQTEVKLAPLQTREVIEKLKTLRAQILLDEEYNRMLEVRVKQMELEQSLQSGEARQGAPTAEGKKEKSPAPTHSARANIPPRPSIDSSGAQLAVKSVTVSPFKEAMVVYKGRLYTVRPGDELGDVKIRDITENGVITNSSSVTLEQ